MNILKYCGLVLFYLLVTKTVNAQTELVNLTGVLSQGKYAEISVLSDISGLKRVVATYAMNPTDTRFALAIPYRAEAVYQLKVTVMKKGHLRLERDYDATFALALSPNQNIDITLNPAEFNDKALKGIIVQKQAAKFSTATISGSLLNWKLGGDLILEQVVEGRSEKIESFNVEKENGSFNFLIPIKEEGFYYLVTARWKKRIYLKPNDKLNVEIDGSTGVQTEWKKATAENKVLSDWEKLIEPATNYGYKLEQRHKAVVDPAAFSVIYESLQPKITTFSRQANTSNAKFNKLFKTVVQLDNSLLAMRSLLNLGGKKHLFWLPAKEFSNVPAQYIQILNQNKINSSDLLQFGEGNEYINLYAKFSLNGMDEQKKQQLADAERLQLMMAAIPNETLKAFLLKSQLDEINVNNYSEFKQVFSPFKKYTTVATVKAKYDGVLKSFVADTVFIGKPAYDFVLPDVNGKQVSMKDFKGKVVLVDVWATWCGPCKAQMPFLKEVEETYKGNDNIVFVGISLDTESAKQKWLDMIKEKGLEGVQLLDNSGKSFAKKYKITAIPRFLLIDKKGNWVEVRCPLPEDKARLKAYIDRELSKGV